MPYINTVTTKNIPENKMELIKKELGEIISLFPGKSEQWLMLSFEPGTKMYFRGDDSADSAFVEVKVFGKASPDACDKVTAAICALYERELGIPSDRTYVRYEESSLWGWNGSNF